MKPSKRFDQGNEVRAIARERIGIIKKTKVILPKTQRKTKHAKKIGEDDDSEVYRDKR